MSKVKRKNKVSCISKLHIHNWAVENNLHLSVAILAQNVVSSCQMLYEIALDARNKAHYGFKFAYPDDGLWMGSYETDDPPLVEVSDLLDPESLSFEFGNYEKYSKLEEAQKLYDKFWDEYSRKKVTADSWKLFCIRSRNLSREYYKAHIDRLQEQLFDIPDKPNPAETARIRSSHEVLFLLKVWLPCWIEYHQTPNELLTQPRTGDIEAIEKLLRIDRGFVECDPLIIKFARQARMQNNVAWSKRYSAALEAGAKPLGQFSRKRIKYWMAGYIYVMAQHAHKKYHQMYKELRFKFKRGYKPKFKLSYTKILELFDALSRDITGKIDPDFCQIDAKSFETRVRKYIPFWEKIVIDPIKKLEKEIQTEIAEV